MYTKGTDPLSNRANCPAMIPLKVHMHEIFISVCNPFLHNLIINRCQAQYTQHFSKIFFKFAQIFEIFYHSLFSPKTRNVTKCCRQKRAATLSVVFVTARFASY